MCKMGPFSWIMKLLHIYVNIPIAGLIDRVHGVRYTHVPWITPEISQLIQVKFLKNGLLLIFAPCLRRATGHLPAITALFL